MDKKLQKALTLVLAIVFVGVGGFFLVREANASTPEDALFPLDKFAESVTRLAITNPEAKIAFEIKVLDERLAELDELTEANVDTSKSLEEIDWQVDSLDKNMNSEESKLTLQQREEIKTQYQAKLEAHIQTMEKVQEQVGNDTAQQSIQKSIDRLDTKLGESQSQKSGSSDTSNGSGSGNSNTNGKGN